MTAALDQLFAHLRADAGSGQCPPADIMLHAMAHAHQWGAHGISILPLAGLEGALHFGVSRLLPESAALAHQHFDAIRQWIAPHDLLDFDLRWHQARAQPGTLTHARVEIQWPAQSWRRVRLQCLALGGQGHAHGPSPWMLLGIIDEHEAGHPPLPAPSPVPEETLLRILHSLPVGIQLHGDDGQGVWHNTAWTHTQGQVEAPTPLLGQDGQSLGALQWPIRDDEPLTNWQQLFDSNPVAMLLLADSGHITHANAAFGRLMGWRSAELRGWHADRLKGLKRRPSILESTWQHVREEGAWQGTIWGRKGNVGKEFPLHLQLHQLQPHGPASCLGVFHDLSEQHGVQERLFRQAHYDSLTQLPNRLLLEDRLAQGLARAQREHHHLAICYLDLDGFKPVNDQFGHQAGDRLLQEVAKRLEKHLRGGDTVARLGGDEFVLLLRLDDEAELPPALNRVRSALEDPYWIQGHAYRGLSASIGATVFPRDLGDPETLLRHADQAMYSAKQAGRQQSCVFDAERDKQARVQHEAKRRLAQAVGDGELRLHFQPKINSLTGDLAGAEALVRWQHPDEGLLRPAAFLHHAEDPVLSQALGEWVIEHALRQMAQWSLSGLQLRVAVNIAGTHLLTPGFPERLQALLAAHPHARPDHLELEVLETAALEDLNRVTEVMARCRLLGVSFALDDFGTGYSALSYLKQLPADTLKIDRSFVRDMLTDAGDLAIVQGVIGLARAFGRQVVAEGVESKAHGERLHQLGCHTLQGFGIAEPMSAADFSDWASHYALRPSFRMQGSHGALMH